MKLGTWLMCGLMVVCANAGCGDDAASSSADAGDGSSTAGGDAGAARDSSVGSDAGSGSEPGSAACSVRARDLGAPSSVAISDLTVTATQLVYLVSRPIPTIDALVLASGEQSTLFTSRGRRKVRSVYARGGDVFFLEDNEDVVPAKELFRLPAAGGTPERVGTHAFPDGDIFAVDDGYVFVWRNTDQPVGSVFERVDIATGALDVMARIEGTGTPSHVTLSGDQVFFTAGAAGSATARSVYAFSSSAAAATPSVLWEVGPTDVCGFPQGGLAATPTKLVCGFGGVGVRERDGSAPQTIVAPNPDQGLNKLVAVDGENAYLIGIAGPGVHDARMKRVASTGGAVSAVVCDLGAVATRLEGGFFPIAAEHEVVVGEEDVFWVEQAVSDSGVSHQLRAAAK